MYFDATLDSGGRVAEFKPKKKAQCDQWKSVSQSCWCVYAMSTRLLRGCFSRFRHSWRCRFIWSTPNEIYPELCAPCRTCGLIVTHNGLNTHTRYFSTPNPSNQNLLEFNPQGCRFAIFGAIDRFHYYVSFKCFNKSAVTLEIGPPEGILSLLNSCIAFGCWRAEWLWSGSLWC